MAQINSLVYRLARRLGLVSAFARCGRGRLRVNGTKNRAKHSNSSSLIEDHFATYSDVNHPCRLTLSAALDLLGESSALIVETGSSAWGTNSTLLFDSYCNSFGGNCLTVDIRIDPLLQLQNLVSKSTSLYLDDSVSFLKRLTIPYESIDLLYLDSWDVDWADPIPSAIHGMSEYLTAIKYLKPGSLVLIDDTPKDLAVMEAVHPTYVQDFTRFYEQFGFAPGKGALVKHLIESTRKGSILAHDYQLLIRT